MTDPPTGNWGRWGQEDERGALNLLGRDTVRRALSSCTTAKVYNLGVPIRPANSPNVEGRTPPQRYTVTNSSDAALFASMGAPPGVGGNEDVLVLPSHTGTHLDGLCHVYAGSSLYNGHPHDSFSTHSGAAHCGIEKAGGFVARGVLVDVAAYRQVSWLDPGHVIDAEEFAGAVEDQNIEIRRGDVVIVRTGWLEYFFARDGAVDMKTQPGIGLEVVAWLDGTDVVAIGADNTAVEVLPFDHHVFLGVHIECLVKRGIYLLEHLVTAELSADRCQEFLLAVASLPIPGATASPVNPIAIG